MRLLSTLVFCSPLVAQTFQIVPSMASRGGTGSLPVVLVSPAGKEPVALQWKMTLGTEVTAAAEDFVAGESATAAGKSMVCAPVTKPAQASLTYSCILSGGRKPIANGAVFLVKYTVKPKANPGKVVVRISDGIAVSERSNQLQKTNLAAVEGTITIR